MSYRETLLSPIKIGTRTCENRFFAQAMECNDQELSGDPSEKAYERYENLFKGETGLISLEAISVTHESRSRDRQLMIKEANREPLTKFVQKVKAANPKSVFIFQLTHT